MLWMSCTHEPRALAKQHGDWGAMGRRVLVGICVLAGVGSFGVSVAPGAELIDPTAIRPNPVGSLDGGVDSNARSASTDTLSTDATNADDSWESTLHDHGDSSGSGGEEKTSVEHGINWCRWWGFKDTANEVQSSPGLEVGTTLQHDIAGCLSSEFQNNESLEDIESESAWVGEYLALQNGTQLVEAVKSANEEPAVSEEEAVRLLTTGGFSLPTQTWQAWLNDSAAAVPPAS